MVLNAKSIHVVRPRENTVIRLTLVDRNRLRVFMAAFSLPPAYQPVELVDWRDGVVLV